MVLVKPHSPSSVADCGEDEEDNEENNDEDVVERWGESGDSGFGGRELLGMWMGPWLIDVWIDLNVYLIN